MLKNYGDASTKFSTTHISVNGENVVPKNIKNNA